MITRNLYDYQRSSHSLTLFHVLSFTWHSMGLHMAFHVKLKADRGTRRQKYKWLKCSWYSDSVGCINRFGLLCFVRFRYKFTKWFLKKDRKRKRKKEYVELFISIILPTRGTNKTTSAAQLARLSIFLMHDLWNHKGTNIKVLYVFVRRVHLYEILKSNNDVFIFNISHHAWTYWCAVCFIWSVWWAIHSLGRKHSLNRSSKIFIDIWSPLAFVRIK